MVNGYCQSASEVRKNWSMTIDSVVHERPAFITRTRDNVAMLDARLLTRLLKYYQFHVQMEQEEDGSYTAYSDELQLVENAKDKDACIDKLIDAMKDYAADYYREFSYWSKAPNRASHIPYVIKLLISDQAAIAEDIICRDGKN